MPDAPLSRFLPHTFDATRPFVLMAGKGLYPQRIHARARALGLDMRLVAFEGETAPELWDAFPENARVRINVGQLGHLLKALRRFGAASALMAGQITPRKLFKGLTPDLKALAVLATLKKRNAETIFGAIGDEMQKIGVSLLDARAFMDDELAARGVMAKGAYFPDADTLAHGVEIAKEMARLDVGQGVVVSKGTVLSVEAFEGTDKMLERTAQFETRETLFVKTVKPNQDYRFDVPVFGMRTIEKMAANGVAAAALEADKVILLEKPDVLAAAERHGITLLGY